MPHAENPTGNPSYHSPSDTLDSLNFELAAGTARAAAAALVELADD